MSSPDTNSPVLFGLRYVERLEIPLQEEPTAMRMSYEGDPRDTGLRDVLTSRTDPSMRMSYPGDPRDTGRIDLA
ncbi:MAG: hypothetical protein JXB05_27910 [Myxococcaceae bacterium]|nr:hypothetical protein [Myxococcaceae bacterium]